MEAEVMTKLHIGAAAIALVAGTGSSLAQTPPAPTPQSVAPTPPRVEQHRRMMMMSDRVVTRDEMVDHVRKLFARLDTNRDGFLTREETDGARGHMRGMDGAGPHRFAADDMPDRAAVFARLDTNHDGTISRDEFMAARPEVRQERVVIMKEAGEKAGMHGHGFGMMGHLFEMADANRDGRVSLAEATDAAARHFDQADLNHDGKLTPDERRQAHQIMHGQRS
jgi:hypothetical protein